MNVMAATNWNTELAAVYINFHGLKGGLLKTRDKYIINI